MAAPAEAITTGIVGVDAPKEEEASNVDEEYSFFSSAPLSPETETVPPLMAEEEYKPKENLMTPPALEGANNAAPKEKPMSPFLSF